VSRKRAKARVEAAPARNGFWRHAVIVLAVFAVYATNLSAPFIFDDKGSVSGN
jgi:anti-sigma-K factor RskA